MRRSGSSTAEEAEVCRSRRLDAARVIDRQTTRYRREGFPAEYGLNEAPVILRRHTDAVLRIDANTAWTVDQTLVMAPELRALGVLVRTGV